MTVSSLVGNLTIEAYRSRGLYRNVSVFCFAQPIPGAGGAISGVDYNFKPTVGDMDYLLFNFDEIE